jgi:hypothetical protein
MKGNKKKMKGKESLETRGQQSRAEQRVVYETEKKRFAFITAFSQLCLASEHFTFQLQGP